MVNGQLMLHAQHPLFDGIVKDVTMSVAVHSPNYGVNDGVNRDTTMYSITQKVIEPKIINTSKNEQIKIVSYDANTKVRAIKQFNALLLLKYQPCIYVRWTPLLFSVL